MKLATAGLLVALLAACTPPWRRAVGPTPAASAATLLADARAEAAADHPRTAVALYERVAREHAGSAEAAEALHGLAVLRLDPQSPVRDRRLGAAAVDRLAAEYPSSPWAGEVRAWRLLLRRLSRCEAAGARLGADAAKLRETLDSLKDTDLELEQGQ